MYQVSGQHDISGDITPWRRKRYLTAVQRHPSTSRIPDGEQHNPFGGLPALAPARFQRKGTLSFTVNLYF
jgi:hypothetical protein